jgi:hypothetical protein
VTSGVRCGILAINPHIPPSSSAKADDPVRRAVANETQAGVYWIPACAGMTATNDDQFL